MMWLARIHNPIRHPLAGAIFAVLALLLTLGHHLSMAGEALAGGVPTPRTTEGSAPHVHCDPCGSPALHERPSLPIAPEGETCGPLMSWKTPGWDGGERLDRAAPVISTHPLVSARAPIPGEPAHVDPPDIRRAFLQVYLN